MFTILTKCTMRALLLCLQDWGKPGDLWKLDIQWHVPSAEEIAFSFELLDSFLQPELDKLGSYADGNLEMSRFVEVYLVVGFFSRV